VGIVYPAGVAPDGMFFSRMNTFTGARSEDPVAPAATDTIKVPRVRWDMSGRTVDTVGWELRPPVPSSGGLDWITVGANRYPTPRPSVEALLTISLFDGAIHVENSSAESAATAHTRITKVDLQFDTVFSHTFRYQPQPYDAAALDSIAWSYARIPGGGIPIVNGVLVRPPTPQDSMAAFSALRAAMNYPAFQHPFQYGLIGRDGAIWLWRYDVRGRDTRWVILSPDGKLLRQVVVPAGTRVSRIDGDLIWTIVEDEMGIPWVVRYSLRAKVAER
jgi:hypothetical protein